MKLRKNFKQISNKNIYAYIYVVYVEIDTKAKCVKNVKMLTSAYHKEKTVYN